MSKVEEPVQGEDGRWRNASGQWVELYEGRWTPVRNADRSGWWRYHEHYDRDGYCDNPARGY